ncbi:HAD family hydrolase [Streptomyces sp. NPDC059740]|uniref:HAD family hydrolase n=1 Tax=Streptomyces sp. NPDC059740 TaxID=3346926 RepID=UPI0036571BE3
MAGQSSPAAVLWDVDDTLFDYTTADRTGMWRHLTDEGTSARYGDVEEALRVWREHTDRCWARFAAGEATFEEQRRDRVRAFLAAPGEAERAMSDAEADAWFDRYLRHYEAAWALFPDVLPALDALADGYRHGVLSNSSIHNQDRKLRVLGVRDRFEVVLCAAELGVAKPAPEAFHAACDALGLAPHEVVYVGDHPDIDAVGAREAGLLPVWLDRGGWSGAVVSDLRRITTLAELPALLGRTTRFGAPSTFG